MRRNMRRIIWVSVAALASAAFALKLWFEAETQTTLNSATDPLTSALDRNAASRAAHSAWLDQQTSLLGAHGKEANSAGFALLRPSVDPYFADPSTSSTPLTTLHFDFWPVDRACADVLYININGFEWPETDVSIARLFENSVIISAQAVAEPTGGLYRVEITFDGAGVSLLSSLISGSNTIPGSDWYGINRDVGVSPTEMTAVLVADGVAYLPFSVTSIVNHSLSGRPIVVAKALSRSLASTFVTRLGF